MNSKDTFFSKKRTLNLAGTLFELSSPIVMGILNITPDSFFAGSRSTDENSIVNRCEAILTEGGTIIDIGAYSSSIGAYSSRPSSSDISEEEEMERLLPALKLIRSKFPNVILSVDTFRSNIARRVVEEFGVQMVNDISAGELDDEMMPTVASLNVPYIMMHMRGTPQTMQQHTSYNHLIRDMIRYFVEKIDKARQNGINDVILDPGFGFSKNLAQNYEILARLAEFRIFQLPILVGISRKSMICKATGTNTDQALAGTITANTLALVNGADILRVHDVKEAVDTIKIVSAYQGKII